MDNFFDIFDEEEDIDFDDDTAHLDSPFDEGDSELDDEDDFPRRGKSRRKRISPPAIIPGHLQTPINRDEVDIILNNDNFECNRHKRLKEVAKQRGSSSIFDKSRDPIECIQTWVKQNIGYHDIDFRLDKMIDSLQNWTLQKIDLFQGMDDLTPQTILHRCNLAIQLIDTGVRGIRKMYEEKCQVEILKDKICNKDIQHGQLLHYYDLSIERDITFMNCRCCGEVIMPTSLFLCALDKLQTKFQIHALWIVSDALYKYPDRSIFDRGSFLYRHMTNLRKVHGAEFYKLMNLWEPLTIGWTILQNNDVGKKELYEEQIKTIVGISLKTGVHVNVTDFLPLSDNQVDITMGLELVGLCKAFGYPVLTGNTLFDKLREYGVGDNMPFDPDVVNKVYAVMKRDLILNYYKKHRRHLSMKVIHPELAQYFTANKPIPQSLFKKYDIWENLEFKKNFEYDYTPDQTELLRDSALCLPLQYWSQQYDACMFKILYGKSPPDKFKTEHKAETRTIRAFLKSTPDKVKKTIQNHIKCPDEQNHVVNICLKEQELTPYGRAFIVQTEEQRLIQTSSEFNISSKIFPYVPQQSMTDNEIKENQRTLGHIADLEDKGEVFVLDLTKWCLFWRHYVVYRSGVIYDQLFGFTRFYSDRHRHSIDCNILPNSRLSPPDFDNYGNPLPGTNFMNRFSGGFEGLCQKQWTHITECACVYATELTGVEGKILGQGDNQVIVVRYAPGDDKAAKRDLFIRNLYKVFAGIGHKLKREETWNSIYLHEYGKARTYAGNLISSATKKAVSLMSDHNDFFNSMSGGLSALNTMTEGIARVDYSADCGFILNQMCVTDYLCRKKIIGPRNYPTYGRVLTNYPLDFGGLPLSSYQKHTIRGHSDSLSQWLSIYKTMQRLEPNLLARISKLVQITPVQGKTSYRIIEDIYALNIDSLPTPELAVKDKVREYILTSDDVTNPTIKDLCSKDYKTEKDLLLRTLFTMAPFFPPLAHEIYRCSNVGLLDKYPARFTAVRTISDAVRAQEGTTILDLISRKNKAYRKLLINRMDKTSIDVNWNMVTDIDCPTEAAREIRRMNWGKELVGLTKPPFQHFFHITSADYATQDILNQNITVQVDTSAVSEPTMLTRRFGSYKGYTGSSTRAKIVKASMDFAERTGQTEATKALGRLKSWMSYIGAPGLESLVDQLIAEKMKNIVLLEGTEEDYFDQIMAGNIFHRLLSSSEKQYSMYNSLPGISTHFHQTSNKMQSLSVGGKDHNIFYQLIYIANAICLYQLGIHSGLDPLYLAYIHCHNCLEEFTEVQLDIPSSNVSDTHMTDRKMRLVVDVPLAGIQQAMEFVVSLQLARSIDKDYVTYHKRMESEIESRSDVVSMNDFRRLDLTNILGLAFFYSSHCYSIVMGETTHHIQVGFDRSFKTVAECLMNSGRLNEFFLLVSSPVIEHTVVTQIEKLSSYIARIVVKFLRENILKLTPITLGCDIVDVEIPYMRVMNMLCKLHPVENTKIKIKSMLKKGSPDLMVPVLHAVKPELKIPKDKVVSQWRSQRFQERHWNSTIVRPEFEIPRVNITGFTNYHESRIIDGPYKIPQLGYIPRQIGVISSAASKYVEILGYLRVNRHTLDVKNIYCLAEGSGGTATILASAFPTAQIQYNTLINERSDRRDDPTDWMPPAAKTVLPTDRFTDMGLSCGVTDILDDKFINKLIRNFESNPPDIITMDAESSEDYGDNLEFVDKLVPICVESVVTVLIFKIFYYSKRTDKVVEELREKHNMYKWLLIKPICSNPVGHEIFLVGIYGQYMENVDMVIIDETWKSARMAIAEEYGMTSDSVSKYLECVSSIVDTQKSMTNDSLLRVNHRFAHMVPSEICSLNCVKLLLKTIDTVNLIDLGTHESEFYIAVRRLGVDRALLRMLHDVTYLFILHFSGWHTPEDVIRSLCQVQITENLKLVRKREEPVLTYIELTASHPPFINNWGDAKFYLRDLVNVRKCECKGDMDDVYCKEDFNKTLPGKIIASLIHMGFVSHYKFSRRIHLLDNDDYLCLPEGHLKSRRSTEAAISMRLLDPQAIDYKPEETNSEREERLRGDDFDAMLDAHIAAHDYDLDGYTGEDFL